MGGFDELGIKNQIFQGITGDTAFGENRKFRAVGSESGTYINDFFGIGGKIADACINLSDTNFHKNIFKELKAKSRGELIPVRLFFWGL